MPSVAAAASALLKARMEERYLRRFHTPKDPHTLVYVTHLPVGVNRKAGPFPAPYVEEENNAGREDWYLRNDQTSD